jgi:hypothetical protein
MKTTALLLGTAAALAMIGTASAAHNPSATAKITGAHHFAHAPVNRANVVLYDQNDNSQGYADISQNFESSFDGYDSQGSDDFTVPANKSWKMKEVDVTGLYFNGPGLARSENVTFYKDKKGKPGKVLATATATGSDDGIGDYVIPLKVSHKFKTGHYWVSVQANMDYSAGGEWGWATRTIANGDNAQWENPGDGFGTGCTSWADEQSCLGGVAGPDHMFTLRGTSK